METITMDIGTEELNFNFTFRELLEAIKHENRFILKPEHKDILDKLVRFGLENCTIQLNDKNAFFRARLHPFNFNKTHYSVKEMSAPPKILCTPGRLNPAGIRYLYCACDEKTAITEMRPTINSTLTLAKIRALRKLSIIDTTVQLENLKKINNPKNTKYLYTWMNNLSRIFSEPVHNEDPISYTPTQYLAELFKNAGFEGIKYKSAMNSEGFNLVIFNPDLVKIYSPRRVKISEIKISYVPVYTLIPFQHE